LELQADLQGAADLQAGQKWPFLFVAPSPEIFGKYRKNGTAQAECSKKTTAIISIHRRRRCKDTERGQVDGVSKSHTSLQA